MPKVRRKPISLIGRILLALLCSGVLYALWASPIVGGGFLMLIVGWSWIATALTRRKLSRIAATRTGDSIGTFAREADYRKIDTWILRAVYEQLREYLSSSHPNFPLRWNDRLSQDLDIDDEDLDDYIAVEIAERTGQDMKSTKENPFFGKVLTVGDLVLFFNEQPRVSET
jgi:hypothetical protein